ncbi:hypothetical protein [Microlunatus speluncae]|uniref:hypothetical protein n=1 Tax=Microlunatus speluncae TaxID=2594267 RepID=UPI00126659A6|nr:hypothetical protein [Microlunatus speluncae]
MSFHLADLDGQLGHQSMMDPQLNYSTMRLSYLAAKKFELNRALAERRQERRAAKARSARGRRLPVARTA